MLNRKDAPPPRDLQVETHRSESLGGEVYLRSLTLSQRLYCVKPADDDDTAGVYTIVPRVLACGVLDGEHKPIYTEAEWEQHGVAHMGECLEMFNAIQRLSGLDAEAVEKKSQQTTS